MVVLVVWFADVVLSSIFIDANCILLASKDLPVVQTDGHYDYYNFVFQECMSSLSSLTPFTRHETRD